MSEPIRSLIRRMADELDHYRQLLMDDRRAIHALAAEARAALAQPEPEGPTDEELLRLAASAIEPYQSCGIALNEYEAETETAVEVYGSELIAFARAVLARWGRPVAEGSSVAQPADGEVAELAAWLRANSSGIYRPAARAADLLERMSPPQPIPVSERLPGPGDCDAEGRCWWWDRVEECWWHLKPINSEQVLRSWSWTHWLPAHALPVPAPDPQP